MATKPKEMALPDFSEMSMDELQALVNAASEALEEKKDARRQELLAELEALGGVPEPVKRTRSAPAAETGSTRAKPPVKYRDDSGNSWTGRGATPRWLREYEEQGKSRDDFKV